MNTMENQTKTNQIKFIETDPDWIEALCPPWSNWGSLRYYETETHRVIISVMPFERQSKPGKA